MVEWNHQLGAGLEDLKFLQLKEHKTDMASSWRGLIFVKKNWSANPFMDKW